jgi:hypothetical protein
MSAVTVEARVVAAGPGKEGNVLLTISLVPAKRLGTPAPESHLVSMADWPRKIHELMTKQTGVGPRPRLGLVVAPIGAPLPASEQDAKAFLSYSAASIEQEVINLWDQIAKSAWAGREDGDGAPFNKDQFWDSVATVFAVRAPGDLAAPRYMVKPAGATEALPNVAPTCRSDAAIAFLLERAERLAERISAPNKEAAAEDLPTVGLSTWDEDQATREAGAAKLKTVYDAAIAGENKSIDDAAAILVGKNKEYLTKLRDYLKNGGPFDAAAPVTLSGYPVSNLFGKTKRDEALGQARTLHLAALLPDVQRPSDVGKRKAQELQDEDARLKEADPNAPLAPLREGIDTVARTFVAAIRSSPMLARLFRFVVDVEIPLADLALPTFTDDPEAKWGGKPEQYVYTRLGAVPTFNSKVQCKDLIFTLAKATQVVAGGSKYTTGFWPVTREEVELRGQDKKLSEMRRGGTVAQVTGVCDLAQAANPSEPAKFNPRFDIITIDAIHAMEVFARNERKMLSLAESSKRLGPEVKVPRAPFHNEREPGLVTRGLVVVDRWRADSAAREIMTAEFVRNNHDWSRVLDADDLTVGYRFDVAVRVGEGDTSSWRSLMEREIDYRVQGTESHGDDPFRHWFRNLSADLEFERDRRRNCDAGMMMPSARRRILDKPNGSSSNPEMIHAEEMIATWEGDPLGLNCHSDRVDIRPGTDVSISRLYNLPNEKDEEARKAWPLRYGWAYRFGMRPVWLGGISLPLVAPGVGGSKPVRGEAVMRYDDTSLGGRSLTLPAAVINSANKIVARGWRRLLRHEPIAPPLALLPKAIAHQSNQLAPQTGVRAVLRTLDVDEKWKVKFPDFEDRETPFTWRVILPSRVSLDQAVRHGAFGQQSGAANVKVAPGHLLDLQYDTPIDKARAKKKVQPDDPDGQTTGFPTVKYFNEENQNAPPVFEDFFDVRGTPSTSRLHAANQYYVDPMAEQLVVAIRPNTNAPGSGYFDGDRLIFNVFDQLGARVKPVVLEIARLAQRPESAKPGDALRQKDFWAGNPRDGYVNGTDIAKNKAPARMFASVATLRLAPGEAVDVDCWFVPSIAKLRAFFDWPETLAVQAAVDAEAASAPPGSADFRTKAIDNLAFRLGKNLGGLPKLKAAIEAVLKSHAGIEAWVGLGGKVADPVVIAAAAEILHDHMQRYPIPELAAIRTIEVVHAVARPPRLPEFDVSATGRPSIQVLRVPSADKPQLDALLGSAVAEPLGRRGYGGIAFAGSVKMDRDTCRQLEILAHCVSPARAALDDVRLGRTELQRLLGEWPVRVIPIRNDAADAEKHGEGVFQLSKRAHFLFGFDVDARGKVYLPKQWVTLLRIDDLGEEPSIENFSKPETINLLNQQIETLNRRINAQKSDNPPLEKGIVAKAIRAAAGDQYSDRLARQITVMLRATSRFDQHFVKTRARENSDAPVPETQFPPNASASSELITRSSYEGDTFDPFFNATSEHNDKKLCTLWIPSTIVPAKPEVHAILPSYVIERPTMPDMRPGVVRRWKLSRRPQVRILLDRPWYSSGEGERLGIVLWPPQLRAITAEPQGVDRLKDGQVPRSVLHEFKPNSVADLMELADFEDRDLGPGGKFTTRWGGDPIRNNDGPKGPFLPAGALSGFDDTPAPGQEPPGYEKSIAIPLEDLREVEKKAEQQPELAERAYETMMASLATFVPRFDVESEKWFVDVAFNYYSLMEPFVRFGLVRYQEHAAEGLRVSAPVVSWAQVYPARTMTVRAWRSSRGAVFLKVHVNGLASGRARNDTGGDVEMVYPKMRISVVEIGDTIAGLPRENVARARREGKDVPAVHWSVWSSPTDQDPQDSPGTWKAGFILPPSENDATDGKLPRRFGVIAEEIEEFSSTADESAAPQTQVVTQEVAVEDAPSVAVRNARPFPLDIVPTKGDEIAAGFARQGPRFLGRIEIEGDSNLAVATESVLAN